MPKWLAFATYLPQATLLIVVSRSLWITLVFPVWPCVVSVFILIENRAARLDPPYCR